MLPLDCKHIGSAYRRESRWRPLQSTSSIVEQGIHIVVPRTDTRKKQRKPRKAWYLAGLNVTKPQAAEDGYASSSGKQVRTLLKRRKSRSTVWIVAPYSEAIAAIWASVVRFPPTAPACSSNSTTSLK